MSLIHDFREFAIKGNVVDMAVGVIIGAAFGKIVSSLVSDVVMPPLGLVIGGIDFSHFELVLRDAHDQTPAVTLKYGLFVQNCIDFLIIAAAVFAIVKLINRLRRQQEHEAAKPPPEPPKQEQLLTEIRDILKAKAQ